MEKLHTGHLKICKLLIEHGANINAHDKDGITPLHVAAKRGNKEICELILDFMKKQSIV